MRIYCTDLRLFSERVYAFHASLMLLLFVLSIFCSSLATAKVYKIDGSKVVAIEGKTEKILKQKDLQSLIDGNVLKAGDRVELASGYYGTLNIGSLRNSGMISVVAGEGQIVKFDKIRIRSSENWKLRGLLISPSFKKNYNKYSTLVSVTEASKNIHIERSTLYSVDDISKWRAEQWKKLASDGIIIKASSHITVRDNLIRNINKGIAVDAGHSLIEKNRIENFSGRAISGNGNYSKYQYNRIKNCYVGGRGHVGGVVFSLRTSNGSKEVRESIGGVLKANHIVNSEVNDSRDLCKMAGIRLYGGVFSNWRIENNVVIPSHWSGISVHRAREVVVIHNTVYNPYSHYRGAAQISVRKLKNGEVSQNIVINNISQDFSGHSGGVFIGNIKVRKAVSYFEDPSNLDFRLRQGSRAVNAAVTPRYFSALSNVPFPKSPLFDINGINRPQGLGRDVGAHELREE